MLRLESQPTSANIATINDWLMGNNLARSAIIEGGGHIIAHWGEMLEAIVVDDQWQRGYGTFDVDTDKWPDMPGFIARQHAKERRVLLWVPGHHPEGLDPALCVDDGGRMIVDVTNPNDEASCAARCAT